MLRREARARPQWKTEGLAPRCYSFQQVSSISVRAHRARARSASQAETEVSNPCQETQLRLGLAEPVPPGRVRLVEFLATGRSPGDGGSLQTALGQVPAGGSNPLRLSSAGLADSGTPVPESPPASRQIPLALPRPRWRRIARCRRPGVKKRIKNKDAGSGCGPASRFEVGPMGHGGSRFAECGSELRAAIASAPGSTR
jgi:hypothetical protein